MMIKLYDHQDKVWLNREAVDATEMLKRAPDRYSKTGPRSAPEETAALSGPPAPSAEPKKPKRPVSEATRAARAAALEKTRKAAAEKRAKATPPHAEADDE